MVFFFLAIVFSVISWVAHDVWVGKFNDVGPIDWVVSHPLPENTERK